MTNIQIPYQQEYLDYLEIECGNQPRSIEGYFIDLGVFFRYLREKGIAKGDTDLSQCDPLLVGAEHLRDFLTYVVDERENGPRARNRKMASIKNYYRFLVLTGRLKNKDNPARRIQKTKEHQNLPVFLNLEEAAALIKASRMDTILPYRDHAMIRLFLQTGLRLDELVQLERGHINLEEGFVRVLGKGDRERLLPLTDVTAAALREHLDRTIPFAPPPNHKVFRNHRGQPVTWRGVQMIFESICKKAGVVKPGLSPHKLRHTCFTLLLREGVDIMTLKELAGHKDINSTVIYCHVDMGDVREAVEKHPLG